MKVTSSYGVEILHLHKPLRQTLEIYRRAVKWLIPVFDREWGMLSQIPLEKKRFNEAEHLVHTTKYNQAIYAFDDHFPKMPSYLRRAAISQALGDVSSYHTRHMQWEESGTAKGEPVLGADTHCMPVFYRDNMYREKDGRTFLKLYSGSDWVWMEVKIRKTDLDYLRKYWNGKKAAAPVLVKRYKKYFLQFAYDENVGLSGKPAGDQVVCAVDLGVNTDAVCSIMHADGTVAARRFISLPAEKDQLYRILGRIRKKQRKNGPGAVRGLWEYARRLNTEIAKAVAGEICAFACLYQADVIVFEYLEMKGKIRGKTRQKLHLWKKNGVQEICMHKAHRMGIRVSRVCAKNTSAYAFDGSGRVSRDEDNHSMCTFPGGKRYHCDLSASYNIGARYFVRELLKPFPETERSLLAAKVPGAGRRTLCSYADFLALLRVISPA